MKRTLLLFTLFCLLGGGTYYAMQYKKKALMGSKVTPDMDFSIPDTDRIYKIFLADRTGKTVTLERNGQKWMFNKTIPARPTAIEQLLETMRKIKVNYVPPEAAEASMVKSIAAEGIKVETYDKDGKIIKVYYVGGVTPDETGTYMMMEGAEHPYVTHIPSLYGAVRVHYRMEADEWYDRTIFEEKPESIQSVSVEYPLQKSESFKIDKTGELEYAVTPFFSTTPVSKVPQKKGIAEAYLLNFEKLGVESHESNQALRDSITALIPFAILTLKKTDGSEKVVKFWPIEQIEQEESGKIFNIRYLAECSWGPFVLTQHQVFGPVFRGYNFFFGGKSPKTTISQ